MAIIGIKNSFVNSGFYKGLKSFANGAEQAVYDVMPSCIFGEKADKFCKSAGRNISSAENRLILGATALISQPFIDFHNRNVDEDTKRVSVCRTIAKIIAGTTTGYTVRKLAIKGIGACSQMPDKNIPKWRTFFTPKNIKEIKPEAFKQYKNALGTFISLGVMLFTNFLIDAPLTKFLTNTLNDKFVKCKSEGGTNESK